MKDYNPDKPSSYIQYLDANRSLKFYQSKWMEPYIRKNTDLRKFAKNALQGDSNY